MVILVIVVENKFLFVIFFSPDLVRHWMMVIKVSRFLCLFSFKNIIMYFLKLIQEAT